MLESRWDSQTCKRDCGGKVCYLMAEDEGHGFQKKKNVDFQFVSTIQFFKENLLN